MPPREEEEEEGGGGEFVTAPKAVSGRRPHLPFPLFQDDEKRQQMSGVGERGIKEGAEEEETPNMHSGGRSSRPGRSARRIDMECLKSSR